MEEETKKEETTEAEIVEEKTKKAGEQVQAEAAEEESKDAEEEKPLDKMTVKDLKEIAKVIPGVTGEIGRASCRERV